MIQSIDEGRKEAGQRSIADKIIKRLHDLEKTVENNQGRWAWELLQNAKDSIAEDEDRTVSVQIELDENIVIFRHNGTHFISQDVIGLIDQISSKEVEEGEETKKVGRFGTGFLTTHLLSKVININGIIEEKDGSFYKFKFCLDRRGKTISQLLPNIRNSWDEFDKSIKKISPDYDRSQFNTSFSYQLDTDEQKRIANIGIEEFSRLIPFILAFIAKISKVEIIDKISEKHIVYEKNNKLEDNFIVYISKIMNGIKEDILILYSSNDRVAIATEIEKCQKGYSVKDIRSLPKLFCDFPLIGTEKFYFPVLVNSFFFNPKTERDGIWLKGDDEEVIENKELLESSVDLYKNLVSKITQENFFDLFNIVETKIPSTDDSCFDKKWYQKSIQEPIREFIKNSLIVESEDENSKKMAINDLYFPKINFSESVRDKVWQFLFDLAPNSVCKKLHLHNWLEKAWGDWETVDYPNLANKIEKKGNINNLSKFLRRDENATFEWLNSLIAFFLEDDNNTNLIRRYSILPNQNGDLKTTIYLYIDAIQDDELIYILELLGIDWKSILLHDSMIYGRDHIAEKSQKDIAAKITEILNAELKKFTYNENKNLVRAISILSEWFENNSDLGKELFSELYRKRAEIFMNTIQDKESLYKVMRNCSDLSRLAEVANAIEYDSEIIKKIQNIKEINNLLKEFNASNISDLKTMLKLSQKVLTDDSQKIEITQETLLSLGVTTIDEFENALRDNGIAAKFSHTSTPTVGMFQAVQKLIERTKKNVIEHLQTLEDYDCSDFEELATTVIGGIKKDGLPIYIVVRPSDNGEVIIYYSSEKDTLDYPRSELWIDNGSEEPERLTLGKILKTTGINRIPVN